MVRDLKIDWLTILLWFLVVLLGWLNLYSTSATEDPSILNFSTYHGKEAFFILVSLALGILVLFLDTKFLEFISYFAFGLTMLALLAVLFMSKVSGASSWFAIGGFKIQPTEFAKVATLMALAKYMSRYHYSLQRRSDLLITAGIVLTPSMLVILQNDAGSALVFFGLMLVLYREGMNPLYIAGIAVNGITAAASIMLSDVPSGIYVIIGIVAGLTLVVSGILWFVRRRTMIPIAVGVGLFLSAVPFLSDLAVEQKIIKPHHSARLRVLATSEEKIREDDVLKKTYYNLGESLVAIGCGGIWGKGYGNGTHTRGDFVPEEHTDYIFCVVGEEHGFTGSTFLLILYVLLVMRVVYIAENSKSSYARVYGYGVAAVLMVHIVINVGMTIGLLPTVGIPLPFFSYGGSSMIAFTVMLFVLMNHYSYRTNILT